MSLHVLITGASSGIGLEIAKIFARNGYNLVLVSRSKVPTQSEFKNVKVNNIQLDLSSPDSVKKLKNETTKRNIKVDYLVNNAGFGDYGNFIDADYKKISNMMQLNMNTLTQTTHMFLPDIVKSEGKIMNIASTAAFFPGPKMAVYYATKNYVLAFSEALAEELSDSGVTVTTLCPGPTSTGFASAAKARSSGLFKGQDLPNAQEVAEYGFDSMISGKRVAVHGLKNKLYVLAPRLIPRKLVVKLVKKAQSTK